jgi:hypothetical protein
MDRKQFLVISSLAPVVSPPTVVGVSDLRLLVTAGRTNRVGVLACCSTFVFVSGDLGATRTVNVPRPLSGRLGWHAVDSPATPLVNPAFHNDDVVYEAVPDDVTASLAYRTGVIFAFKPRIGDAYLVHAVPGRGPLPVFALGRARPVQALFLAPDGLHVVFGADAQVTIAVPPDSR